MNETLRSQNELIKSLSDDDDYLESFLQHLSSMAPHNRILARTDIDFKIDGECQDLIFESSDDKLFSISKVRAAESKVWRDMLKFGKKEDVKDQPFIRLTEDSRTLLGFFTILGPKDWVASLPQELQKLQADSVVELVEAAEKYEAHIVFTFVYLELKRKMVPTFLDVEGWQGFQKGDGWDNFKILKLFVITERSEHQLLLNVAAKMTILIPDLLSCQTRETLEFVELRKHLAPLQKFRMRWEKIKGTISGSHFFNDYNREKLTKEDVIPKPLNHVRSLGNPMFWANSYRASQERPCQINCGSRSTAVETLALYLDQALLDLEYKGMDEID